MWIDIVDANGTVVYGSTAQVTLGVTAPGSIVGPATVTMKAGQLATWVRSGSVAGPMTLTASSTGLTAGTLTLNNDVEIVGQSIALKTTSAGRNAGVVTFMGNRAFLPQGFAGKATLFSVYDISGRLVRNALTRDRIAVMGRTSDGIYIVKVK